MGKNDSGFAFVTWVCLALLLITLRSANARVLLSKSDRGWRIENGNLAVSIDPRNGFLSVLDKRCGYKWRQPDSFNPDAGATRVPYRDITALADGSGVRFVTSVGWSPDSTFDVIVTLRVPDGASDLVVGADLPDRGSKLNVPFLDPFIMDALDSAIAAADGCSGHLYPSDVAEFPGASMGLRNLSWYPSDRLDMPWIGIFDMKRGMGYALIIDTPDDGILNCRQYKVGDRRLWAPRMIWLQSMGRFAYPRQLIYRFAPNGGYVALAKAYRDYADSKGLIVPFREKAKVNPNIRKLFGAPSVWGILDLNMAREAKTAGVDRMLMQRQGDWLQKRPSSEDIAAINSLGYLTSEYDNYVDIYPLSPDEQASSNHGRVPEDAIITSDGELMKAWWDGIQYARKRCPSRYGSAMDSVLPDLLHRFPFTARFFDVVAAQDLYECYNLAHPLTKSGSRRYGAEHFGKARGSGLVTGGEHGVWWAVPYVDYFEGMMSGGFQSWSAGNLSHPKTKDESIPFAPGEKLPRWPDYEKWGIGHETRIPLWELVFHDCVSTTWYWGDSNDWLLDAAPEVMDKKNAFNVLYGNTPMLWSDSQGSWNRDRPSFMRTYRNVCKLNEEIADKEMLSHQFLTGDRSVQMTLFSDGTRVIVNFGGNSYTSELPDGKHVLPQNGFAVYGRSIRQSRELINGRLVTTIRKDGYRYSDRTGVGITLRRAGSKRFYLNTDTAVSEITFAPSDVIRRWAFAGVKVHRLDKYGKPAGLASWTRKGRGSISLDASDGTTAFDITGR